MRTSFALAALLATSVDAKGCMAPITTKVYTSSDCSGSETSGELTQTQVDAAYNTCIGIGSTSVQPFCDKTGMYSQTFNNGDCSGDAATSTQIFEWGKCVASTEGGGSVIYKGATMMKAAAASSLAMVAMLYA